LTAFATEVLERAGMTSEHALVLAANLVDAEVRGVNTHGLARLVPYLDQMRSGDITLRPEIDVHARTPVAADVDGGGGLGVLAGVEAMKWAVGAARQYGIGVVGVRNVGHLAPPPTTRGWQHARA